MIFFAVVHVLTKFQIGKLRTKVETTTKLRSYFDEASKLNTKTKVQKMRTASGVKDTFQLVFLEKLFESYKGKRGKKAKQAALDAKVQSLPKNTTSPVWRIQGGCKRRQNLRINIDIFPKQAWTHIRIRPSKSCMSSCLGLSNICGGTLYKTSSRPKPIRRYFSKPA